MFLSNTINIPLAIFTVILRRFIDRVRHTQPQLPIACRATSWLYNHPAIRPLLYAYLLIAGIRYIIRQMEKGTLACVPGACDECLYPKVRNVLQKSLPRPHGHHVNKSFILKNLAGNRARRQKALEYVASLTPPLMSPLRHTKQAAPKNLKPQRYNYDLSTYTFNPYFDPKAIPNLHGANISGNPSAMSENVSLASDDIATLLHPKGTPVSCSTNPSASTITTRSFETYCNKMAYKRKQNIEEQSRSVSLSNSEATCSLQVVSTPEVNKRKRDRRSITTQASDTESFSPGYRMTRSGRIYDQASVISKLRKK